ncbi:MAG: hypothetical protein U9R58_05120 [Chloroflexota bacterium]|nr:hypothetical protein [Chloroflexota bacterium]
MTTSICYRYTKRLLITVLLTSLMIGLLPLAEVSGSSPASGYQADIRPIHGENSQPEEALNQKVYLPIVRHGPGSIPTEGNIYGVETHTLLSNGGVETMADAGAHWVRRNGLLWNEAEPVQGQIDWSSATITNLENELIEGYREGIEPIIIVRNTPSWAQKYSGSICGPIRQDKLDAFGVFMEQIVAHFSAPPYNVKYWELGNEPDVSVHYYTDWPFGCWGDGDDPYFGGRYYAEMLKRAYPKIKSVNPEVEVLVGGLLLDCDPNNPPDGKDCLGSKFMKGILVNNGGSYFDGVSYHAYDYYGGSLGTYGNSNWHAKWNTTGPILNQKTPFLKNLLAEYGLNDKYLVLSEVSLLCDGGCDYDFEQTKANYLAQAYSDAHYWNIEAVIWYDVLGGWRNGGLIEGGEPLPAYYAFQFSHQELYGADAIQDLSDGWLRGYEFQFADHRVWILWSGDGIGRNYTLPARPSKIFDRYGNAKTTQQTIYLDRNVTYIEWVP